ncbi:uncharacterized protein LOC113384756 [Ctenocephalides felis]|uniref:uncharacterized protein LOC113384756 n=1 Tax=Ctenocephalides felis TaxID=7515 RepID=UPI000E6E401F|nr:uncharacterized protein LOC113384756 [Ctenocephalides felis]
MYNQDQFLQEFKPIPWWTLYYKPVVEKLVPLYAAQKQENPQTQVQDIWSLWNSAQNPPYQQNPSYQQNVPYQPNPINQRPQMNAQNPGTLCTSNYYGQNQNCNPDPYYPQTQYTPYVQTQYQQTQYPLVQPQVYSQNQVMSQSQYPSIQPQNLHYGPNQVLSQSQYPSSEFVQSSSFAPPNPTPYQVQENEVIQESDIYRPDNGGQKQQFHHLAKCLGAFEVYSHCLGHCDRTCDGSDRMPTPCSADICIAGCNCISGYSRDEDGQCIETSKCKKNEDKEGKGPTKIVVAVMKKDRS